MNKQNLQLSKRLKGSGRGGDNSKNKKNKNKGEKGEKSKPKDDAWKLIYPKKGQSRNKKFNNKECIWFRYHKKWVQQNSESCKDKEFIPTGGKGTTKGK